MPGKSGAELGADLGALWHAGKHTLPQVADDYWDAATNIPTLTAPITARGGGLGQDPGGAIDGYAGRVYRMLLDTRLALSEVAEALVWVADEYAATDASCRAEFERKKGALSSVEEPVR